MACVNSSLVVKARRAILMEAEITALAGEFLGGAKDMDPKASP